jgi:hypothetical protein
MGLNGTFDLGSALEMIMQKRGPAGTSWKPHQVLQPHPGENRATFNFYESSSGNTTFLKIADSTDSQ